MFVSTKNYNLIQIVRDGYESILTMDDVISKVGQMHEKIDFYTFKKYFIFAFTLQISTQNHFIVS